MSVRLGQVVSSNASAFEKQKEIVKIQKAIAGLNKEQKLAVMDQLIEKSKFSNYQTSDKAEAKTAAALVVGTFIYKDFANGNKVT
ncbi:MAG: hypothetical protein ACK41T_02855 [Pseudobdellovibrio sp.]